jgi:hypothetical protein
MGLMAEGRFETILIRRKECPHGVGCSKNTAVPTSGGEGGGTGSGDGG